MKESPNFSKIYKLNLFDAWILGENFYDLFWVHHCLEEQAWTMEWANGAAQVRFILYVSEICVESTAVSCVTRLRS